MQVRGGTSELVRQAARMQRKMGQIQAELKDREVSASAAADKVKVTVRCEGRLLRIEVDPEFFNTEGLEMTCAAITAAANNALAAAEKVVSEEMSKATGGIKLPNMGG